MMNDKTAVESDKPFAPTCERNQEVILQTLQKTLRDTDKQIFEIGSGTGQHAVYLGKHLPHITWQTSDVVENHIGIKMWLEEAKLTNVMPPVEYEIGHNILKASKADVVFNANTIHIISEKLVKNLIQDLGATLEVGARVVFYGPFKYRGEFTSESNADFDLWLKGIDPLRGIRDIEAIEGLMNAESFVMIEDIKMPANNQYLIFEKQHKRELG